jgi:sulfur dehydrogenase subunit SoxC (EC 1.-.-.-)
VKSVVNFPCPEMPPKFGKGRYEVTGFAWSGNGKVKHVDVSFDGGKNWRRAELQDPVLDKCMTRFVIPWEWDGGPALVGSRAVDSTGTVQPTIGQLRAARGAKSVYHNNSIQFWQVTPDGKVNNVQLDY